MEKVILLIFTLFVISAVAISGGFVDPTNEGCSQTLKDHKALLKNQDLLLSELRISVNTINELKDSLYNNKNFNHSKIEFDQKYNYAKYDILGSILGAVIAGIIAIFVFFLGRRNEKIKEKRSIKSFGEELYVITKNITKNSEAQIENLTHFQKSINERPMKVGNYKRISIHLLNRVKSFSPDKIFGLFKILGFNNREFVRYYNQIDFLEEIFRSIENDFERITREIITPLTNRCINIKKEFFDISTDYIEKKRKENDKKDKLYTFLNDFIVSYYTSDDLPEGHDLDYDYKVLIRPLLEELVKSFRDWDISNDLIKKTNEAANTAYSIREINLGLASDVGLQIENIKNSIQKLQEIENELAKIYAR